MYSSLLARRCLRYDLANFSFCLFQVFGCMKMQIDGAERNSIRTTDECTKDQGRAPCLQLTTKEGR